MHRSLLATVVLAMALPGGCGGTGGTASSTSPAVSAATPSAASGSVDVGGHSLSYSCTGQGTPTVILEHGLGGDADEWSAVMPAIAAHARVCAYSRLQVAGDAPSAGGRTAADSVADLHTLLAHAGIKGPYVMVGFSFGGLISQLYARTFPSDVIGLVLVDSNSADEATTYWAHLTPAQVAEDKTGTGGPNGEDMDILASFNLVKAAPAMPDVPLIVVTHTVPDPNEWPPGWDPSTFDGLQSSLQTSLTRLTSHGSQVFADGAGHDVPVEKPAVVNDAILKVLADASAS